MGSNHLSWHRDRRLKIRRRACCSSSIKVTRTLDSSTLTLVHRHAIYTKIKLQKFRRNFLSCALSHTAETKKKSFSCYFKIKTRNWRSNRQRVNLNSECAVVHLVCVRARIFSRSFKRSLSVLWIVSQSAREGRPMGLWNYFMEITSRRNTHLDRKPAVTC